EYFEHSPMIITALLPVTGYEQAARLLAEFQQTGARNMQKFLEEKLGKELVERLFSSAGLTALGHRNHGKNTEK
ncbi:MAG: hypothetical protein ABRQ33_08660, partial [Smithellaceae bacterium]